MFLNEEQRREGDVSDAQRRAVIQGIERNVRAANAVVIDGDLIDGYSLARKELHAEQTFSYAMGMLKRWCEKYPNKQFYYALGNHCGDVNIEKRRHLLALSHTHPNLHVNDYGIIIGDTLFMHGDLQHQNDAFELSHRGKKSVYRDEVHAASGEERTRQQYNWLVQHLQSPDYKEDIRVLRHREDGGAPETVPLTKDMLQHIKHFVFGHTHEPVHVELEGGKTITNLGCMRHHTKWRDHADGLKIKRPEHLQQQVLWFEGGRMVETQRAFALSETWADMVKETAALRRQGRGV
jgi:Calcineurin-like phosphoesterase